MIVVSAGIIPRDKIAKQAGLKRGVKGGIAINNQMMINDPNTFAIGECVSFCWDLRVARVYPPRIFLTMR